MARRTRPEPVVFLARPWDDTHGGSATGARYLPGPVLVVPSLSALARAVDAWPWEMRYGSFRLARLDGLEALGEALRLEGPAVLWPPLHADTLELDRIAVTGLFRSRAALTVRGDECERLDVLRERWERARLLSDEISSSMTYLPWCGPRRRAAALIVLGSREPTPSERPGTVRRGPLARLRCELASRWDPTEIAWCDVRNGHRELRHADLAEADLAGPIIAVGLRASSVLSRWPAVEFASLAIHAHDTVEQIRAKLAAVPRVPARIHARA